ncbi:hypothetical protein CRG98_022414 [Punica granatum]|uniref:Uncharacterized protein n=1 Tax=Punica granatum TaxID=22663 RepID=A0A2I0JMN5_PUNGR|nr:hypothetical protein CRG98_022414 [Punica granatum]
MAAGRVTDGGGTFAGRPADIAFQWDDAGRTLCRGGRCLGFRCWDWWRDFSRVYRGCACRS